MIIVFVRVNKYKGKRVLFIYKTDLDSSHEFNSCIYDKCRLGVSYDNKKGKNLFVNKRDLNDSQNKTTT